MGDNGNKKSGIIRLLRADEIECRAASVSEKGLSLLLYKDARVDQRILDKLLAYLAGNEATSALMGSCTAQWKFIIRKRGSG